ncbi:MAG: hypothetical protein HYV54_02610 [Parcubacteria group bacterium]|nr:hypothetical protein [Parcubacteria group bacterium]
MNEASVVWQDQGVSVCKLSLEEIAAVVAQGLCWVLPAAHISARNSETALMTDQMIFNNDWIRRLSDRHMVELTVIIVSKVTAPTEDEARARAKTARTAWEEKRQAEELTAREKVKALTQKAKMACEKCVALANAFKGVNIFDDEKKLAGDPMLQKQVVSLGLALESLAEVISSTIEALLNGDPSALVKADQSLSEISETEVHLALKTALDALGSGHEAGLKKRELEEIFLAAFFSCLLREKDPEYAGHVYNLVRVQKPKIPDVAGIIQHHRRIEWTGFDHYLRLEGSYRVMLVASEELVKILLVALSLEFNQRVLGGESPEMVLEDMGWRYKKPAAGPIYSAVAHVTAGLPPYSRAWSGLCNRLGLVPKKAIVEFTRKTPSANQATNHLGVQAAFGGNAARYLGLLGGTGVSLGHRPDIKFSPLIWLLWKKGDDGKYSVAKQVDRTNLFSITTVAAVDGELRMALLPVGYGDLNPQIYARNRRRVIGLLDNESFAGIKNAIEQAVNIQQVISDLEKQKERSPKQSR